MPYNSAGSVLPGATRRPGCGTRAVGAETVPRRFFGRSVSPPARARPALDDVTQSRDP